MGSRNGEVLGAIPLKSAYSKRHTARTLAGLENNAPWTTNTNSS